MWKVLHELLGQIFAIIKSGVLLHEELTDRAVVGKHVVHSFHQGIPKGHGSYDILLPLPTMSDKSSEDLPFLAGREEPFEEPLLGRLGAMVHEGNKAAILEGEHWMGNR